MNIEYIINFFYLMFQIEAMVLGSLAWRSDSPLFDAIELKGSVPSYEEVWRIMYCDGYINTYNVLGVFTS